MPWEAIKYVSSALTLCAFVAAAIVVTLKNRADNQLKLVEAASEIDRPKVINDLKEFFPVDTEGLDEASKENVILEQIKERSRRYLINAVVIVLFGVMALGLAIFAIDKQATVIPPNKPGQQQWQTVEGEFSGQFNNVWDVRFDGKPFSCAPSPNYGQTLCTAMESGTEVSVNRYVTTDDNPCIFHGTVIGDSISGTYQCTKKKGPYEWHATIIH
jgi:hypothetical protein